jgi:hypothetical protein
MISHACSSCGKMLDGSSRSYSPGLRMWIARCSRCGFAVRWSPRHAREPARIWARLRALNLRLGVAIGALQFGVILMLFTGSFLYDRYERGFVNLDLDATLSRVAPALIAGIVAGVFVGLSAATLAPHRRLLSSLAMAWAGVALPCLVLSSLLVLGDTGAGNFFRRWGDVLGSYVMYPETSAIVLGAPLVVSLLTAFVLRISIQRLILTAVRKAARGRRQTLALVGRTTTAFPKPTP